MLAGRGDDQAVRVNCESSAGHPDAVALASYLLLQSDHLVYCPTKSSQTSTRDLHPATITPMPGVHNAMVTERRWPVCPNGLSIPADRTSPTVGKEIIAMAKKNPANQKESVFCPICGEAAESGCVYGPDGWVGLRWRAGEPSVWGNVVTSTFGGIDIGEIGLFHGTLARGIRCASCRRIVLECINGEDGPGIELACKASDLERDGEWDQALALCRRILDEPRYQAHHEYARNAIRSIENKKAMERDA